MLACPAREKGRFHRVLEALTAESRLTRKVGGCVQVDSFIGISVSGRGQLANNWGGYDPGNPGLYLGEEEDHGKLTAPEKPEETVLLLEGAPGAADTQLQGGPHHRFYWPPRCKGSLA